MSGFFDAVSLLTRVPTRGGADTERAVPWFPVVGALIGLAIAGIYEALRSPTTPLIAAGVAVAAGLLLTGALHEDGLADVADAFGAGVDRSRTLEILEDPHHGTYGVAALVASIIVHVAAIAGLGAWAAIAALPAAQAISRAAAAALMWLLPSARPAGLGATYAGRISRRGVIAGLLFAAALSAALLGLWSVAAVALVVLVLAGVGALSMRKIGGVTGDVLGTVQQLTEIAILVLAVAAGASIPWWR